MDKDLERAISDGPVSTISELLQQPSINVKATNSYGETALHLVIRRYHRNDDRTQLLEMFIKKGVDLNAKNKKHQTALHLAMRNLCTYSVDILLKHNANINVPDDQGNLEVHYLMENFLKDYMSFPNSIEPMKTLSVELIKQLNQHGFDFDRKNKNGESAIYVAVDYNLQNILPYLLKHSNDINFVNESDSRTLLQSFLETSKPLCHSVRDRVPWTVFPRQYSIDIVRILLERGVNINHEDKYGLTALHIAVNTYVPKEVLRMLFLRFNRVQNQVDVELVFKVIRNLITTECLINDNYFEKLIDLMSKGMSVNSEDENGFTIVYYAVKYNHWHTIDYMKTNGIAFKVVTNNGDTLFHALAEKKSDLSSKKQDLTLIFNLLLFEGCDINARNFMGMSPLHVAAENSNQVILQHLLTHGVDVDCRDDNDWTPLYYSISKNNLDCVKLLLNSGAKVNLKNRHHIRPIHLAIKAKYDGTRICSTLINYGATVNVHDENGHSLLVKAFEQLCMASVVELLEYGADINDDCVVEFFKNAHDRSISKFVRQHWIKLNTAKLPCSKKYEDYIDMQNIDNVDVREKCLKEVGGLKSTLIDSHTTLYNWLHMDPYRRYVHTSNEKLLAIVNSPILAQKFPQYSTVILNYYHDTQIRRILLQPAKEAWLKWTVISLPDICLEHIFSHLNTGYLLEFIEIVLKLIFYVKASLGDCN